jgi:hypothetical protein
LKISKKFEITNGEKSRFLSRQEVSQTQNNALMQACVFVSNTIAYTGMFAGFFFRFGEMSFKDFEFLGLLMEKDI